MKLRKVKLVIRPLSVVKSEWKRAIKGKVKSVQPRGVIVFTSVEALGKVLSPGRLHILATILKENPKSIYALAKNIHRDFKNVYHDVKLLAEVGLLELKADGRKASLVPHAKYSGFELDLAA